MKSQKLWSIFFPLGSLILVKPFPNQIFIFFKDPFKQMVAIPFKREKRLGLSKQCHLLALAQSKLGSSNQPAWDKIHA